MDYPQLIQFSRVPLLFIKPAFIDVSVVKWETMLPCIFLASEVLDVADPAK